MTLQRRTVHEIDLRADRQYPNPFIDVRLEGLFTHENGQTIRTSGFYRGDNRWTVRFNPSLAGTWTYEIHSTPADSDLAQSGSLRVDERECRGLLRSTPGVGWSFSWENGEPAFLLGDTAYNLIGMAYCGVDTDGFLHRRARQGFNMLRVRVPVSRFHPPDGFSDWQTKPTWPWGGSPQCPDFSKFNLPYFDTMDRVMYLADELGIGFEMVMEAWGGEFPMNDRSRFTIEWEEHWLSYLIARYDAFTSVYTWTPLNEYEHYPDGHCRHTRGADLWMIRTARFIKRESGYGHIVSVHNGPQLPPFSRRFATDPGAVDAVMLQTWGNHGRERGWLADGIEEEAAGGLESWQGSALLSEYGYERNPELPRAFPLHDYCDADHVRRGSWRGAFAGLCPINGFENSWGPFAVLDKDQPGLFEFLHLRRFFTEVIDFSDLRPSPELIDVAPDTDRGYLPRVLANAARTTIAVYLPAGGAVALKELDASRYTAQWFDTRTGETVSARCDGTRFESPGGKSAPGKPWDWVLVLREK